LTSVEVISPWSSEVAYGLLSDVDATLMWPSVLFSSKILNICGKGEIFITYIYMNNIDLTIIFCIPASIYSLLSIV